jgi:hypothetical protein
VADLTPERLARLRVWAERRNAHRPDGRTHLYDGSCPWCRGDDIQPGAHDGYFDGNAHDLAIELLDEIDRLRDALNSTCNPTPEIQVSGPNLEDEPADTTAAAVSDDMAVELPVPPDRVVDLMAALERSVADAKAARTRRPQLRREDG